MKVYHRLVGKNLVAHHEGCGCDFLRSVKHAPWITYDMMDGLLTCDHCKAKEFIPTPSVRSNFWSKEVYLDHDAIADDLNNFKDRHQDCVPKEGFILASRFRTDSLTHDQVILPPGKKTWN